jgi:bifunctional DNA-binding transcriptional regulator/antitoxin component of YhaV-PrlF toxin-antitoxin module
VTLPKAVRKALVLERGDLVVFCIEQGNISVKRGRIKIEG